MTPAAHHRPPQWMLDAPVIDALCIQCRTRLRRQDNQIFCLSCWEYRTRLTVERARHAIEQYQRALRLVAESTEEDDTQGLRLWEDQAAVNEDWQMVLHFKWRIVVLEMTGQRPPTNQRLDAA